MAAGVEARDTGGVLENAAAGLRLGRDDLADLPLPHQRGRAGAGRGVGEEDLHVAGTDFLAVDAVGRAFLALDPAGDFQHVGIVEGCRRGSLPIVDGQHHLGGVARRPPARARRK